MLNKWLILLFGLITLLGLLYFKYYNDNEAKVNTQAVTMTANSTASTTQENTKLTTSAFKEETKNTNLESHDLTSEQQAVLREIESRLFSDDAFVELTSLSLAMELCRNEIDISILFSGFGGIYQQQKDMTQAIETDCADYRKQYPNILSMDDENLKNIFQPNSPFGRLLKSQSKQGLSHIEYQVIAQLKLLYSLQEKNSSLLIESSFLYRYGGGKNESLKFELKSNDTEYVGQMSQLALVLISCQYQNGQSCSSTSNAMVVVCSQDLDACGLDFQTWYEKNTLPGMKRDVEKLMAYFEKLSS